MPAPALVDWREGTSIVCPSATDANDIVCTTDGPGWWAQVLLAYGKPLLSC